MSSTTKTLEFKILNTIIPVLVGDDEDHIREIASNVKQQLDQLKEESGNFTNSLQIAVIGCMNLTESLMEVQDQLAKAKLSAIEQNKRNDFLSETIQSKKIEINQLQDLIKALEAENEALMASIKAKDDDILQAEEAVRLAKEEGDSNRQTVLNLQNQLFETQIELSQYIEMTDGSTESVSE